MGVQINPGGADFKNAASSWNSPVSGLLYGNFFTSPAALKRNLATGGAVQAVGAPSALVGATLFDGGNYVDTGVFHNGPAFTLMGVFASLATNAANALAFAISAFNSPGGKFGTSLYCSGSTALDGVVGYLPPNSSNDTNGFVGISEGIGGIWRLGCLRCDGSAIRLADLTTNQTAAIGITGTVNPSGVSFLVGAGRDGQLQGQSIGIQSAMIFGRSLTDAEMAAMAAPMRAIAAAYGITV